MPLRDLELLARALAVAEGWRYDGSAGLIVDNPSTRAQRIVRQAETILAMMREQGLRLRV